ncbi:MAG: alanyl-tRNA editing protein [Candidatus Methanoplasma sp.]|jgi:alanyl-tRNA synthetase|nr:alanyl-tRNA editing protein [Candidatus Methanoplasma sp.]
MTDEIFRRDGYAFEFEARVASVDGDLVELDSTAFYPGGGGQACDTGAIRGVRVEEAFYGEGGAIMHRAPGHGLKPGDLAWCTVDWDRRYALMQGHTGEHLLFCSLKRLDPELEVEKISIAPEGCHVVLNRDVPWDLVRDAVRFANSAIGDNLPVTRSVMDRGDPEIGGVRVKLDRIPEGEEITVVSIGDIDHSACSGIHVMETGELEMIVADRKTSAGPGVALHFKAGRAAAVAAAEMACECARAADAAGSKPADLARWAANARRDLEERRSALRILARERLGSIEPEEAGGARVFSAMLPAVDRDVLSDAADAVRAGGGVAIYASAGGSASIVLASGDARVDCGRIVGKVLGELGGKGGGKREFAQGGVSDPGMAGEMLERVRREVSSALGGRADP